MFVNNLIWKRWWPILLWMGMIFAFSAQPSDALPSFGVWDILLKKGAHFTAYAILGLLVFRATGEWKRPFLFAFVITVLYAAGDEFHQLFVPGRHGTLRDVLIDMAGGLTGLTILYRARLKQKQMQSPMPMSDRP